MISKHVRAEPGSGGSRGTLAPRAPAQTQRAGRCHGALARPRDHRTRPPPRRPGSRRDPSTPPAAAPRGRSTTSKPSRARFLPRPRATHAASPRAPPPAPALRARASRRPWRRPACAAHEQRLRGGKIRAAAPPPYCGSVSRRRAWRLVPGGAASGTGGAAPQRLLPRCEGEQRGGGWTHASLPRPVRSGERRARHRPRGLVPSSSRRCTALSGERSPR